MAKLDSGADVQEACDSSRLGRLGADPHQPGRAPELWCAAELVGRCEQQQPLCLQRQLLRSAPERLLDPARDRCRCGRPEPHRQLGGRQAAGKLDQCERIAARLGNDSGADSLAERSLDGAYEQLARVLVGQAFDHHFGQACKLLAACSGREQEPDTVGEHPSRHERERLRRWAVEPLGIVDHTQQRLLVGGGRQQAERRKSDQEPLRCCPGSQPECGPKRVLLRLRQAVQAIQHRFAQMLHRSVGQLDFRLHSHGMGDPEPVRRRQRVLQQRGLADSRVAAHHEHRAPAFAHGLDQSRQLRGFTAPADELHRWRTSVTRSNVGCDEGARTGSRQQFSWPDIGLGRQSPARRGGGCYTPADSGITWFDLTSLVSWRICLESLSSSSFC